MSIFRKSYRQGQYVPVHPEKCLNTNGKISAKPPEYRSSWELKFMRYCDIRDRVLEWGSEIIKIPYYSEVDGKTHQYVTDFYFVCRPVHGEGVQKYICEVKPKSQVANLDENGDVVYPDPPKVKSQKALQAWQERCNVIRINNCKWQAARKWCRENGFIFKILSEEQVGSWASNRS